MSPFAVAQFLLNSVDVDVGNGTNSVGISVNLTADATDIDGGGNVNAAANIGFPSGLGPALENTFTVAGGTGVDTVDINLSATSSATGGLNGGATARVSVNTIGVNVGDGTSNAVNINLDAAASASFTAADTGTALAHIVGNQVDVTGGTGADTIGLNWNANASVVNGGASATISSNSITINAFGGNDDITLDFKALSAGAATINSNTISIDAGTGNDLITVNFNVAGGGDNIIDITGGAGADTINVTGATNVTILYEGTGEIGDTINGFDSGAMDLSFASDAFADDGGNLFGVSGAGVFNWGYYQNTAGDWALFYNAAGATSSTFTTAAVEVAAFDTNVTLTANNIDIHA